MDDTARYITPGMLVRHPREPDWGTGQVQSNVGGRITVTFPDVGKKIIDPNFVSLIPVAQ